MITVSLPWQRWLTPLLETACPLCQRSTAEGLCPYCQSQLQACQLPTTEQIVSGSPPIFAWGRYDGALKRAIAALKFDQHPEIGSDLGRWMGQAWLASVESSNKGMPVVPIPLHESKQRQRGFNQAELLARGFCAVTRLPLINQGLLRQRATEAQFHLPSAVERERNLQSAFAIGPTLLKQPPKRPVLLLDDIYTSGATTRSAIATLHRQGIRVGGVIVLARAGARWRSPTS